MFDLYLWLNVFLAFLIGGVWIAVVTIIADRFGSKMGGFIAGLPLTIVVALFFIGLVQGPQAASQATTVFPLIYSFTGLFLVSFAFLTKYKNFTFALIGSLAVWFILSALVVFFKIDNFVYSLIVGIPILLLCYFILQKKMQLRSMGKIKINYSKLQIVFRALFGGLVIAFAVLASKLGGPIFGGIFSGFPAVFVSTLVIGYRSRGIEFVRPMTKSMLVSGMITVVAYAIAVRYLYISNGLIIGTLLAFIISMICAYFTYHFVRKKLT